MRGTGRGGSRLRSSAPRLSPHLPSPSLPSLPRRSSTRAYARPAFTARAPAVRRVLERRTRDNGGSSGGRELLALWPLGKEGVRRDSCGARLACGLRKGSSGARSSACVAWRHACRRQQSRAPGKNGREEKEEGVEGGGRAGGGRHVFELPRQGLSCRSPHILL